MSKTEFEPVIQTIDWPQTHALDNEATVLGWKGIQKEIFCLISDLFSIPICIVLYTYNLDVKIKKNLLTTYGSVATVGTTC
jgi:hypothetical protein